MSVGSVGWGGGGGKGGEGGYGGGAYVEEDEGVVWGGEVREGGGSERRFGKGKREEGGKGKGKGVRCLDGWVCSFGMFEASL